MATSASRLSALGGERPPKEWRFPRAVRSERRTRAWQTGRRPVGGAACRSLCVTSEAGQWQPNAGHLRLVRLSLRANHNGPPGASRSASRAAFGNAQEACARAMRCPVLGTGWMHGKFGTAEILRPAERDGRALGSCQQEAQCQQHRGRRSDFQIGNGSTRGEAVCGGRSSEDARTEDTPIGRSPAGRPTCAGSAAGRSLLRQRRR